MLSFLIIVLVVLVALWRGGSLLNIAQVQLRWLPLVIGSFALQLVIFLPFAGSLLAGAATPWLYFASMLMLVVWVWMNRHIPGISLMAAGLLLNSIAIIANHGYMPVWPPAADLAGISVHYGADNVHNNSVALASEQVRLWYLTDIIALPKAIPFATVYSIGDILLTLGVALFCYRTARSPGLVVASA